MILTFIWGSLCSAQTSAKIQGMLVHAESLDRDNDSDSAILEGQVQIVNGDEHISCDRAKIDLRAKKLDLAGHVFIVNSKNTLGGDQVYLDYESNTGVLINGFVQSGQVLFEGEMIQKTGENNYFVTKADYTTCDNCPSSWNFQGTQIRAELGGYAYIKNSLLKFGSVPVFWLPYLVVPLKSDRQTGLLTPGFEKSTIGGITISQPIFFAISRSQDATYTFKNYEKRGAKSLLNYRYVLSENSYGEFSGAWVRDLAFKNEERYNRFRSPEQKFSPLNRWFLKYDHFLELEDDFVHRFSVNNASDLQYPKDFEDETLNLGDSAMETRMSLSKSSEDYLWTIDSSYYTNLLQSDPLAGNASSVHRIPELRLSQKNKYFAETNFVYAFDVQYLNLVRSSQAWDDLTEVRNSSGTVTSRYLTNSCNASDLDRTKADSVDNSFCQPVNDGKFDPYQDLIRTGQRIDFNPSVFYPISLGEKFDLIPKLSFRETHYYFPIPGYEDLSRRYIRTSFATRTQFNHIYGDLTDPLSERYKHEIQPEITYTTTPWIQNQSHPFWSFTNESEVPYYSLNKIEDGDLLSNGYQFDDNDRIYDRHRIKVAIINKLVQKKWSEGTPFTRQIAYFSLSQSFDAYQESRREPNKESWSSIDGVLTLDFPHVTTSSTFNYFPYQKVTDTSTKFRLYNDLGQYFQVGVTKSFRVSAGQPANSDNRTENYSVRTGFDSKYLNLATQFLYDANWINHSTTPNNRILKSAYIAQLKPPGNCWFISLSLNSKAGVDDIFYVDFAFSFDGNLVTPPKDEFLDRVGLD